MDRHNFCARWKMLRAWHAFWSIGFRSAVVDCASHALARKKNARVRRFVVGRIELAAFQQINRL
jgi:hypothetical protein